MVVCIILGTRTHNNYILYNMHVCVYTYMNHSCPSNFLLHGFWYCGMETCDYNIEFECIIIIIIIIIYMLSFCYMNYTRTYTCIIHIIIYMIKSVIQSICMYVVELRYQYQYHNTHVLYRPLSYCARINCIHMHMITITPCVKINFILIRRHMHQAMYIHVQ